MLDVRLSDLVCGPDLQAILSFNFCSTRVVFTCQGGSVMFYVLSGWMRIGGGPAGHAAALGVPAGLPGAMRLSQSRCHASFSAANEWLLPASRPHASPPACLSPWRLPPFLPPCTAGSPASWMPAPLRALRNTSCLQTSTRTREGATCIERSSGNFLNLLPLKGGCRQAHPRKRLPVQQRDRARLLQCAHPATPPCVPGLPVQAC